MFRDWILSRQCQLTAQAVFGILAAAVFTLARPLQFPHACLAPVFVVIIITSLAQDQHVGSRIQVTALILGPTWLAVLLAASLMSLAKLAEAPNNPFTVGYIIASTLLALLGLAVLVLVRTASPQGPARLMGVLAAVMYGIMVLLSVAYSTVQGFLVGAVAYVCLAMVVACAVSVLAGLLIAPSLASDEVVRLTAAALRGAGAILSHHTSVLMAEQQRPSDGKLQSEVKSAAPQPERAPVGGEEMDIHITVHAAHARPSGAQAHMHRAGSVEDGTSVAAAAAAAHIAAARQHEHATLEWVPDDQDRQGATSLGTKISEPKSSAGSGKTARSSRTAPSSSLSRLSNRSLAITSDTAHPGSEGAQNTVCMEDAVALHAAEQHEYQQWLDEELLQAVNAAVDEGDSYRTRETFTAAWVATAPAAAAALAASGLPSIHTDGNLLADTDDVSDYSQGHVASAAPIELQQRNAMQGLEHAASLEFMAEVDDQAFLQTMRALSRSKPYGSTASLHNLAPQQAKEQPEHAQSSYVKPAASAVSTTGSFIGQAALQGAATGLDKAAASSVAVQSLSPGRPGDGNQNRSSTAVSAEAVARQNTGGSSFLRELKTTSIASFWGGVIPIQHHQQEQQHKHTRHRSKGPLGNSVSWADLATSSAPDAAASSGLCQHSRSRNQHAVGEHNAVQHQTVQRVAQRQSSSTAVQHTAAGVILQQVPSVPAVWDQTAPVTAAELGLLIGRAKAVLGAARLEPHWLRPKQYRGFDPDAWGALLEDAELLLVRVSTLEALSDERRLQGLQLHHLEHYRNIADAMAMTLAQLAAFLAHVSEALDKQQASKHVSGCFAKVAKVLGLKTAAAAPQKSKQHNLQHPGQHRQNMQHVTSDQATSAFHNAGQAASSPFATAAESAAFANPDGASWSAVLSGLERQGSGVSSYLWEKKAGWETGRRLLQREMEAAVGGYWWSVKRASRKAPFKVPRSREVMTLTFIWPITNGLLDALERVEASAQRVLSSTKGGQQHIQISGDPIRQQTAANHAPHTDKGVQRGQLPYWLKRAAHRQQDSVSGGMAISQQPLGGLKRCWSRLLRWLHQQQHWVQPLLKLLTVQPGLQAVKQAVVVDLPAVMLSRRRCVVMLSSRTFQAGMKLYLAVGSTLLITMLLMVFSPEVRHVAPIFGFTSVCLSMQERVEATADKVVGRILGTVLGACLGLGITYIPSIFNVPVLMLACIGAASVPLSLIARAEARVAVALALLTLLAVTLCTFEVWCCSPGPHLSLIGVFIARVASVLGACVYVAFLNRFILPWYTADYALEQMADALDQAAALFEKIYRSQHNRMRVAAVAAGALAAETDTHRDAASHNLYCVASGQPMHNPPAGNPLQRFGSLRKSLDHWLKPGDRAAEHMVEGATNAAPVVVSPLAAAAAELAALEAGEAALHVALRQEVLRRLVVVQLSLAKETVSWKRGVLSTPQVVLDVLGAMIELVEALSCQRLALASFTRQLGTSVAGPGDMPEGLLRVSGHCYSVWAQPLHPLWLEVLSAVHDLAQATAQQLRSTSAYVLAQKNATGSSAGTAELLAKLSKLEAARLQLRRGWLDIRTNLHKTVHAGAVAPTRLPADSIHFFTFTYGASRVLNKLAGVTQTLLAAQT